MNTEDDFTGPINLGNPVEFTILELAEKVIDLTNSKSETKVGESMVNPSIYFRNNVATTLNVLDAMR